MIVWFIRKSIEDTGQTNIFVRSVRLFYWFALNLCMRFGQKSLDIVMCRADKKKKNGEKCTQTFIIGLFFVALMQQRTATFVSFFMFSFGWLSILGLLLLLFLLLLMQNRFRCAQHNQCNFASFFSFKLWTARKDYISHKKEQAICGKASLIYLKCVCVCFSITLVCHCLKLLCAFFGHVFLY